MTSDYPKPIVTKGEGYWEVELMIPDTLIQAVYGHDHMTTSGRIKGNFYKCGDETHTAHYGCWNPIENEYPAFHKPEFFGELILGIKNIKADFINEASFLYMREGLLL